MNINYTLFNSPDAPELLPDHSEHPSDLHGTFPVPSSLFSGDSEYTKTISMHHRTLKCVTLRFGNTPDMVETPLRPMIISGTWMPIMTPVHSTSILSLNNQRRILFPLSLRYLPCPRSDRRYHYT